MASSPVQKEEVPKTNATLLTTPGPQKAETSAQKKKPSKAKPQPQDGQNVSEDEIPMLVPIGAAPGTATIQVPWRGLQVCGGGGCVAAVPVEPVCVIEKRGVGGWER